MIFPEDEEWLEVPSDPLYLISTHGRCYSVRSRGLLLPAKFAKSGTQFRLHWRIVIPGTRKRKNIGCAHYVLLLFGPPRPNPFWVAACLDGNEWNVRLDNLAWRPRQDDDYMRELSAKANAAPRKGRDYSSPAFLPPSYRERG